MRAFTNEELSKMREHCADLRKLLEQSAKVRELVMRDPPSRARDVFLEDFAEALQNIAAGLQEMERVIEQEEAEPSETFVYGVFGPGKRS